jgi:outer membrane protein OmpA-like peptidoglycan-associated protein
VKASFDYTLYDTLDSSETIHGTWLHTRILLDQAYRVTPGFKAEWAAGFIWLNNSIQYDTTEMQTIDFYGLSFDVNLVFLLPGKFLTLAFINRIDLLYALNPDLELFTMSPHYYGGVRLYVDFGSKWFRVYMEAKGQYWNYTDLVKTFSTGIVSGGGGLCIHLPPVKIRKRNAPPIDPDSLRLEETDDTSSGNTAGNTPREEKENLDPKIQKLKNIAAGDSVQFHNIIFMKYSDELLPVSFPVLDQITGVLKQMRETRFTISAYAEYQGNPVAEFKLCTDRANKIKEYLVHGGVEANRLKASSIGQIVTRENQETGPTVIFKAVSEETNK